MVYEHDFFFVLNQAQKDKGKSEIYDFHVGT